MPVMEAAGAKLLVQLQSARQESDKLFGILKPEAIYERPIAERHRVLFYIGHLDGFDSIQVCNEALGLKSEDEKLDGLFQAGIDPDQSQLPTDKPSDWPSLDQVREYAARCRARVDAQLENAPEDSVLMALEHRLMHLETLAYMFHNFDYSLKVSQSAAPLETSSGPAPTEEWREVPAGEAFLGKAQGDGFGWDNEYGELRMAVPAFGMQRYSVTNGAYLQFVKAGAQKPHFWSERNGEFWYRGMFEEVPLPLDWPVYVMQKEAQAYAEWKGKRLPSEEQFHRAAYGATKNLYPWGAEQPSAKLGNFNFRRWDAEPVSATPAGSSAFGIEQLVGNGWQWTRSQFGPFPGFKARASYPGYSANFFDGEHYVMKGGSARTASGLLRPSLRNWFRGDYPYMYTTFRCVEE